MENKTLTTEKKPVSLTPIQQLQDAYLTKVNAGLESQSIHMDAYQKQCCMNALSAMSDVMGGPQALSGVNHSTISAILQRISMLRLNAFAMPRQVYFTTRNAKGADGQWSKTVEMGVEGDGNDAEAAFYGMGVKQIHPYWVVREGDEFKPPRHVGMKVEPPEWEPHGEGKPIAVVYPIEYTDGHVEYHIGYRGDVRTNLVAHINNNLMNETFGICENRYKATVEQKAQIEAKKKEIMDALKGKTIDEIMAMDCAKPYISPAWNTDMSGDQMIIRKMRNNVVKKLPKDYSKYLCDLTPYGTKTYNDTEDMKRDAADAPIDTPVVDIPSDAFTESDADAEQTAEAPGTIPQESEKSKAASDKANSGKVAPF